MNDALTLRDLKGIEDAEVEALYASAYHYTQAGQLADALTLFKGLVALDHLDARFWLGLGCVQQRMGDVEAAVRSYATASLLDLHDPRPQLAAAQCYLKLNQGALAESALLALERFCPATDQGERYRAKARILKRCLKTSRGGHHEHH